MIDDPGDFTLLRERQALYRRVAGGWPPAVRDEAQLRELQSLMRTDLGRASAFVAAHPSQASARLLLADLLRMAHNLDLPDSASRADALLGELLAADPRDGEAALCRGALYVTLSPELGARAEADFRLALSAQSAAPDPLIHQGLGFACLHQGRRAEALEHLRRYLEAVPEDARIAQFVARMEDGEQPRTVRVARPSPQPAAVPRDARRPGDEEPRPAAVPQDARMDGDEQPRTVRVARPSPQPSAMPRDARRPGDEPPRTTRVAPTSPRPAAGPQDAHIGDEEQPRTGRMASPSLRQDARMDGDEQPRTVRMAPPSPRPAALPQDARMDGDEQPRTVRIAPPSPRPAEPPAAKKPRWKFW